MSLVRVKSKYQVTIPTKIRKALALGEGDLLSVEVKGNQIVLTPQVAVERVDVAVAVQEGLEEYRAGQVTPTFETIEEFEAYRRTEAYRKFVASESE